MRILGWEIKVTRTLPGKGCAPCCAPGCCADGCACECCARYDAQTCCAEPVKACCTPQEPKRT